MFVASQKTPWADSLDDDAHLAVDDGQQVGWLFVGHGRWSKVGTGSCTPNPSPEKEGSPVCRAGSDCGSESSPPLLSGSDSLVAPGCDGLGTDPESEGDADPECDELP